MAEQKQKKKSTAAKSAARGGSKSSARGKGGKKAAARPVRREIGAFVCLFLGIFTVLCCFHVNAVVLNLMASLFKGTIGAGFYILPFSFLLWIPVGFHWHLPRKMNLIQLLTATNRSTPMPTPIRERRLFVKPLLIP